MPFVEKGKKENYWTIDVTQQWLWYCGARERENGWLQVWTVERGRNWTMKIVKTRRKPRLSKFHWSSSFAWLIKICSENYWMLSTLQFVTELNKVNFVFIKALEMFWVNNEKLLNSAFVWYEELCRSQRVLSAEADNTLRDPHNSSYFTQPYPIIEINIHIWMSIWKEWIIVWDALSHTIAKWLHFIKDMVYCVRNSRKQSWYRRKSSIETSGQRT